MRIITDSVTGRSASSLLVEDEAPGYTELLAERDRLLKLNAGLVEELSRFRVASNLRCEAWDTVELVACGTRIECVTCGQMKPCMCDK